MGVNNILTSDFSLKILVSKLTTKANGINEYKLMHGKMLPPLGLRMRKVYNLPARIEAAVSVLAQFNHQHCNYTAVVSGYVYDCREAKDCPKSSRSDTVEIRLNRLHERLA